MVTLNPIQNNPEQVKWRCRRGMLELDLMLGKFFEEIYRTLQPTSQQTFQNLLLATDPELYSWLVVGELPADASLHDLILIIRYLYR
jgi:antitoxin CptB